MKTQRKSLSFTLIELITVIFIIGLLVALMTASYVNSRTKARDTKRKQDLDQIAKALESYFQDNQQYVANLGTVDYTAKSSLTALKTGGYIAAIPQDPMYGTAMTSGAGGLCKDASNTNCNSGSSDKRNYLYAANSANPAVSPVNYYALFTYLEKPAANTDIATVLEYNTGTSKYCSVASGWPVVPTATTGTSNDSCIAAYAMSANYAVRTLP